MVVGERKEQPFAPETRIHFLGYSISGYLYVGLLLLLGSGLLQGSRCVVFGSCTNLEDMNPVSVLVIDEDAFGKLKRFHGEYEKRASKDFCRWMEEEEVGLWFRRLFLNEGGRDGVHRFTRTFSDRILIISDRNDEVFPLEAIRKNLGEFLRYQELSLGRHEFPFNLSHLQGKSFDELAVEIRGSSSPSEKYAASFSKWLDTIENFLFSNR